MRERAQRGCANHFEEHFICSYLGDKRTKVLIEKELKVNEIRTKETSWSALVWRYFWWEMETFSGRQAGIAFYVMGCIVL